MMEERYHATTQNRFYPDMSNVHKNITVEAKLISPPTYFISFHFIYLIYAASIVGNGWIRPSVGQTERPDHLSFT